jgi:molybdopterin-containing oxidoreductase family iron-sulfur binding subunit
MPEMTVDKCDFCIGHSEDDKPDPVCARACMTGARTFGDLDEIKKLVKERGGEVYLADKGTSPRVFYLPTVRP